MLAPQQLDPAYQISESDIVLRGRVTKVGQPRWNSPDGKEWRGKTDDDTPIVYTTFFVEPIETLKGSSKWGSPVPFRTLGGLFGDVKGFVQATGEFADLAVGDEIIIMGVDRPFYGGTYEGSAYWSLVNATSVYKASKDAYIRLNTSGAEDILGVLRLDAARTMAAAQ